MSLYHETIGTGPQLVLLHGWGLHAGVWSPLVDQLSQHYTLTLIDLPGHGRSRGAGMIDAEDTVNQLLQVAPPVATWLGWSLGGMLAMKLAAIAPQRVRALILVAASPSFVQRDGWAHGMRGDVFAAFAAQLEENFDATLMRFLSLQVRGVANGHELLRQMRKELARFGQPDVSALRTGLAILQGEDLRQSLQAMSMPIKLILGKRDTLVAPETAQQLTQTMPIEVDVIDSAGHAPFLSHPAEFTAAIDSFMRGLPA